MLTTLLLSKEVLLRHYLIEIAFLPYAFFRLLPTIYRFSYVWLYALFPLASDVILSKQIGFLFMGVLFLILDVDFANQFLTTYNLK